MSWGTNKASGGLGYTPTATRIPFGNAGGTGQTDSADLIFNDATDFLKIGVAGTLKGGLQADASNMNLTSIGNINANVMTPAGSGEVQFWTNATQRVRISAAGDIGIGVAPAASVILKVGYRGDEYFRVATDSTGWDFGVGAFGTGDDVLYIGNGGTCAIAAEKAGGDVIICGPSASLTAPGVVATNATKGFLRLTTCAGVPTGAATTGCFVLDSTNNKVYARSSGAWVALN